MADSKPIEKRVQATEAISQIKIIDNNQFCLIYLENLPLWEKTN